VRRNLDRREWGEIIQGGEREREDMNEEVAGRAYAGVLDGWRLWPQ
jgi:hypothetical protein